MSLEAWGDTDEGARPNPFDDMMQTLRARNLVWECRLCHCETLNDQPCPLCGLDRARVEFYGRVLDAYTRRWANGQTPTHWIVAAVEAYREVVAETEAEVPS